MPELPEVEYVKKRLDRWMLGGVLEAVTAPDARIVRPAKPATFVAKTRGRRVTAIERRGKMIRCLLDDDQRVFIHLGMTGWVEKAEDDVALRFERLRFVAKRGTKRANAIVYVDPRRWGRVLLSATDVASWKALGPDPLVDGIDVARLRAKLARRKRRSIKEVLMDQRVLAGVGNIQAIEALWKAKIDPRSLANAIEPREVTRIANALRWTIDRTLADLAKGDAGAKNPFKIYGRRGTPCPRCKSPLERIELGGRTTTFCPGCQVLKR